MAVRVQVPLRVLCKALVSLCLQELFVYARYNYLQIVSKFKHVDNLKVILPFLAEVPQSRLIP